MKKKLSMIGCICVATSDMLMENYHIQEATTKEEITECYPVVSILRPNLTIETWPVKVQLLQNEGYHLIYILSDKIVVSILGYRVFNNLAWGKIFYIDDLSTLPDYRNKGYASSLLEWAVDQAKNMGCEQLHLDTGFDRKDAQRLYLKYNFNFNSHHMAIIL